MGIPEGTQELLAAKFQALFDHLDERQRRLLMGAEARSLGHCRCQEPRSCWSVDVWALS
jgi:hypothetical protein